MSNDLGVVLDAAALLADRPEIAIVLLGDGKDKSNLVDQAAQAGLVNVRFLPPLPKAEMRRALAAADACLAILKPVEMYKTVYPNKVFDYMAAGRATILAIDGVIREVIEQGEAGVFVPPGNPAALAAAIRELADHPERARQMGANARADLLAHFDRAKLAEELEGVLQEMVERTRSNRSLI
jgi:glycosyltransferase involved in cell wall biosynthesis